MLFGDFKQTTSAPETGRPQNQGNPLENKYGIYFLNMPINEKRKLYRCGNNYSSLDSIPIWPSLCLVQPYIAKKKEKMSKADRDYEGDVFEVSKDINKKVSLWQGDITRLEIDAIVNAANQSLLGGGGVDGSIHRGAGRSLVDECRLLNGCHTGQAKITSGHRLPAKFVIHTVGPIGKSPQSLYSCYKQSLQLALEYKIRSIAFCCISTGVYGYPNRDAAYIALSTVRRFLQKYHNEFDRIIFCTYLSLDFEIYKELMTLKYFPCTDIQKPAVESDDRFGRHDSRHDVPSSPDDIPDVDVNSIFSAGKLSDTDKPANDKNSKSSKVASELSDDESTSVGVIEQSVVDLPEYSIPKLKDSATNSEMILNSDFESGKIVDDNGDAESIICTEQSDIKVDEDESATSEKVSAEEASGVTETVDKKNENSETDKKPGPSANKQTKITDFMKS